MSVRSEGGEVAFLWNFDFSYESHGITAKKNMNNFTAKITSNLRSL